MKCARVYALGLAALATVGVAACARAADGDVGGPDASENLEVRDSDDAGGPIAPAPPTVGDDGGASDGGRTRADTGTTTDAGGDAGAVTGGPCAHSGTCLANARSLGEVDGDQGALSVTATGTRSEWLVVRLHEGANGIGGVNLNARLTLTSPPGSNWDMRVYYDGTDNQVASVKCANPNGSTSGSATAKQLTVGWPDVQAIGGHDDSSNVTVEIRYVSGTCNPGGAEPWSLLVEGNKT